jgi:uncharacterized protein YutE (UPF0331/DUF86 family)
VAGHIVSDRRLGEPTSNRELFDLLVRAAWLLPEPKLDASRRMIGFRDILVQGRQIVDPNIVQEVVEIRLEDLVEFAKEIRERMRRR